MKKIIFAVLTVLSLVSTTVRAEIYQKAALPANATEEQMIVAEIPVIDNRFFIKVRKLLLESK